MSQRSYARWVYWAIGALVLALGLYVLRGVLSPIFFALTIAYLLDPLVDRFERWMPRGVAITLVLTLLGSAAALFLLLVLPGVIREVVQFIGELPDELAELVRQVEPWAAEHNLPIPHSLDEAIAEYELAPAELASHAAAPLQAIGRSLLGGTMSVMSALASLLVVPVLAFYLLYDFDHMVAAGRALIPARHRDKVVEIASEIDAVLGQFLRGQLLVMLAMAVLYGVAYSLVGVRLAVPIALVAGLLAFIPYIGSGSALAMALLMCVVDWDGWTKPLLVVVAYAICQGLEGFVIVPKIVGDKVGLPAVWVLVALLVGGEIFGFLGVLLAVPVAAVVKIFVVRGLAWYRESDLYLSGMPTRAPEPAACEDRAADSSDGDPPPSGAAPDAAAASIPPQASVETPPAPAAATAPAAKPATAPTAKPAAPTAKPAAAPTAVGAATAAPPGADAAPAPAPAPAAAPAPAPAATAPAAAPAPAPAVATAPAAGPAVSDASAPATGPASNLDASPKDREPGSSDD